MRRRGARPEPEIETAPPASGDAPSPRPLGMRMAELSSKSGVARETIHFYLREGLLPRPKKGGRTVAYYGEEHLERLRLIRRLREEKYLPVAVIRRLLESPAAAERDVDALAEVLHIIPDEGGGGPAPSAEALREAVARGLLGPAAASRSRDEARRAGEARDAREARGADRVGAAVGGESSAIEPAAIELGAIELGASEPAAIEPAAIEPAAIEPVAIEPAERRVLAAVEEALALDEDARRLTLDDLAACAVSLTALVSREAELFFDAVFRVGEVGGSIAALRSGRPAVARYIAAYRDLMLRRIVEDLLTGVEEGPDAVIRAATVPLSPACEAALGVADLRRARWDAFRAHPGEEPARALVWHLFGSGAAADLAMLPPEVREAAGARLGPLVAWGAHESARGAATHEALERAVRSAPDLALGGILLGEANVARGVRRVSHDARGGAGLLDEAIPALHRVMTADVESDPEPVARAFGWFHRGRLELALPAVLGRKARGAAALERAIAIVEEHAAAIEAVARVRIAGNAMLFLGRHHAAAGAVERARSELEKAAGMDREGAIGRMAREELAAIGG